MALHGKEIKGFNGTSTSDLLYTYINFKQYTPDSNVTVVTVEKEANRPTITLTRGNNTTNLGYIVCNDVPNTFLDDTTYRAGIWFKDALDGARFKIDHNGDDFNIYFKKSTQQVIRLYNSNNTHFYENGAGGFYLNTGSIDLRATSNAFSGQDHNIYMEANNMYHMLADTSGVFQIYNNANTSFVHVGLSENNTYLYSFSANKMTSKNPINALYFNALSDKRSKTNIQPLQTSVLDIINQIPVYSFNYIENNKPAIGLMAQDLVDINLDNFNLVDNVEATGENGDFMNIHESKLVYVLGKAIQELSNKIQDLEKQLNR